MVGKLANIKLEEYITEWSWPNLSYYSDTAFEVEEIN